MGRWIVFGCVAVILCGAAWYFGKPEPVILPTHVVAVAEPPAADVPKPQPPRIVEVIDLARAYEPVPEREEVQPGGVDPAAFIQVPEAAERIPPAKDVDDPYADVIRTARDAASGWSFWNEPDRERIDLMPREVLPVTHRYLVTPWPSGEVTGSGLFTLPWQTTNGTLVEPLDVMPRQVWSLQDCLIDCNPPSGPFRRSRVEAQRLNVMPREVK